MKIVNTDGKYIYGDDNIKAIKALVAVGATSGTINGSEVEIVRVDKLDEYDLVVIKKV